MAIHFDCPWCTQTISVDESKAREKVECPHCNRPVKVPAKSTAEAPSSVSQSSAVTPASGLDSGVSEPPLPPAAPISTSIEKVRVGQRFILFYILLNLLMMGLVFVIPENAPSVAVFGLISLALIILAIVGIIRLSSGLGYGLGARILIVLSLFIPLVGLIVLLVLSSRATNVLRSAGYKVGLMGAAPKAALE